VTDRSDAEGEVGATSGEAPLRPPLPDYPRVRDLGGGVWLIDTLHHGHPGTIGVFVVALPHGGHALVETGPGVTLPEVLAGLRALGVEERYVTHLLLTHIHLDHAGAAGALARRTGATVLVHEVRRADLVDPSRLMASAHRVYGDALSTLWGEMLPVPAGRVVAVRDGESHDVGGLDVRVVHTPGHASHHVSYLLPDGTLFCGDSAGVVLPGAGVIRPALAPPELDIELKEGSVRRQLALGPTRLVLSHFGPVPDARAHLEAYPGVMRAWEAELLRGLAAGEGDEALARRMEAFEDAELAAARVPPGIAHRYKLTSDAAMNAAGLKRYLTKLHPERVEAARAASAGGRG
jgi:glyoxylase-like metal-dependent hydrolase (beta-lactamase superfamily II)